MTAMMLKARLRDTRDRLTMQRRGGGGPGPQRLSLLRGAVFHLASFTKG
jgi:hypothetical protein